MIPPMFLSIWRVEIGGTCPTWCQCPLASHKSRPCLVWGGGRQGCEPLGSTTPTITQECRCLNLQSFRCTQLKGEVVLEILTLKTEVEKIEMRLSSGIDYDAATELFRKN